MADDLDTLEQRVRDARAASAWLTEAQALLGSGMDEVEFTCANPPYSGLFCVSLPRSMWGQGLEAAVADAQAKVDAVLGVK